MEEHEEIAAKWQSKVIKRGVAEKLETLNDLIRTPIISFPDGSVLQPPPCTRVPASPTLIASSPEPRVASRGASSSNSFAYAANLEGGCTNYSLTGEQDRPADSRNSSAGLLAGGAQRKGSWLAP